MKAQNATVTSPVNTSPMVKPTRRATRKLRAPQAPAAGSVKSQASATRPATAQRTVRFLVPTPEPRIDPVATCVVESGIPKWLELNITTDEVTCEAKPWVGLNLVKPWPIVRMMQIGRAH